MYAPNTRFSSGLSGLIELLSRVVLDPPMLVTQLFGLVADGSPPSNGSQKMDGLSRLSSLSHPSFTPREAGEGGALVRPRRALKNMGDPRKLDPVW